MATQDDKVEIDDSLYSRQRYVLGDVAMKRMAKSNVLLSGLGGIGIEIAKNIALAGVKSLTLHDTRNVSIGELSVQFYFTPEDVGKNRALVSAVKVEELNKYVKVHSSTQDLLSDLSYLKDFQLVILTDAPLNTQLAINEYCRSNKIQFISADVFGVFAQIFVDVGDEFEVVDKTGEEPREILIGNISKGKPPVVNVLGKDPHDLGDGEWVRITDVEGMEGINNIEAKVSTINTLSFQLVKVLQKAKDPNEKDQEVDFDTSSFSDYVKGGVALQLKKPEILKHKSLKESLAAPEMLFFGKMNVLFQIHPAIQGLHKFVEAHGHKPEPWNEAHALELIKLVAQVKADDKDFVVDEEIVRKLSYTCSGALAPLCAAMGGVVAQEGLKALTGKFTPLTQWLYHDAIEVLPANVHDKDFETVAPTYQPTGTRSDSNLVCLGKPLLDELENLKLFMVGAGAIGCEMMKNFAMLGVGGGPNGLITVTDNDLIEKSNLNRQFLFRDKDIQSPKSSTAAKAVIAMNPSLKVVSHLHKVGEQTKHIFTDDFICQQNLVVNALDNLAARLYMDSRCVSCQRPLMESGTRGTQGNTQVIVPFVTESYGTKKDPEEKEIGFCTLKFFPTLPEHCIEWARDRFEAWFALKPHEVNQFFEGKLAFLEKLKNSNGPKMKTLRHILNQVNNVPTTFDECIGLARIRFERVFKNFILNLVKKYPPDAMKDGTPVWAPPKRIPDVVEFNAADEVHLDFVVAMASLLANIFHIKRPEEGDRAYIAKVATATPIPPFKPKDKYIPTEENAPPPAEVFSQEEFDGVVKQLEAILKNMEGKFKPLNKEEFEKDDDKNHHIDFITAAANLRSRNYRLKETPRLQVKKIAGKIIPAIATTTSVVSGLITIELIKVVKKLPIGSYISTFLNLAGPTIVLGEPAPAPRIKVGPLDFTFWDRWEVREGDITIQDLIAYLKKTYRVSLASLVHNQAVLFYPKVMESTKKNWRRKISEMVPKGRYVDLVAAFSVDDQDVDGPQLRVYFDKPETTKQ